MTALPARSEARPQLTPKLVPLTPEQVATQLLAAALDYHRRGFHVVPADTRAKKPLVPWKLYQESAPTKAQIEHWFTPRDRGGCGYNGIALVVGPGGLGVRDFDQKDPYELWAAEHPEPSKKLPTVATNRGVHVWFRLPDDCPLSGIIKDPDGSGELRLSGGLVFAPPSPRADGQRYRWIMPLPPPDEGLPAIDPVEVGLAPRRPSLASYFLERAIGKASIGNRNDTGFWLFCQLRDQGIPKTEAESFASEYVSRVPQAVENRYTEAAALASLESAYGHQPRDPASRSEAGGDLGLKESWPDHQPLPDELPPVMSFDYDLVPEALRPWIEDIAERIQCPPDYPAVAAMIALAGVVGRRIGIRPKRYDDWLVVPNLWGAVIGRPGVLKTPAIQEPLKPLTRLEIEAKQRFDAEQEEYTAAEFVATQHRKEVERSVRKAIQKGGDALEIAKKELQKTHVAAPVRKRHLVNDSTVEKLGELLAENPNGVVVYRDELIGLLRSLDKEGQEGARAFYLEAWNGNGRYTYDRIGRGTLDIEAAIVSVIGGIQPGPLAMYLSGAIGTGKGDDGLMQRFQLAVWPDVSRDWVNVDQWPDTEAKNRAFEVFRRLDKLNPGSAGASQGSEGDIPYLRFSEAAQQAFNDWRAKLEHKVRSGQEHPAIESHLAKYRSLIPSLALLFQLADHGAGPVGDLALHRAIRWGEYLESHARRIYSIAVNPDAEATKALARKIIAGELRNGFALRDVYRHCWSGLAKRDDAASAVAVLVDLDWLREDQERTAGAPRKRYWINPRIYSIPRKRTDKTDKSPPGTLLSVMSVAAAEGSENAATAKAEDRGAA